MSLDNKIKILEKTKIDDIKANWNVSDENLGIDIITGLPNKLPEIQQIIIHLLIKIEELENRIQQLEEMRK